MEVIRTHYSEVWLEGREQISLHYLTAQLFIRISSDSQLCSLESPGTLKTLHSWSYPPGF